MATVTGLTAERMQEIIDATIVDADIIADHLILTKEDGSTIDAGVARGPAGADGVDGADGADGTDYASVVVPSVLVYSSTDNFIANPSGGVVALPFNAEDYDSDTMHDPAVNNTRITIHTAGLYQVSAKITWAARPGGDTNLGARQIMIRKNGSAVPSDSISNAAGVTGGLYTTAETSVPIRLAVNDYLEALAYHDSGATLNIRGGLASTSRLAAYKVSA